MSFDYDPYAVMTIVVLDGKFHFRCQSCGGGWREETALNPDDTLRMMRALYDVHVVTSHQLSRQDTASWHKGF